MWVWFSVHNRTLATLSFQGDIDVRNVHFGVWVSAYGSFHNIFCVIFITLSPKPYLSESTCNPRVPCIALGSVEHCCSCACLEHLPLGVELLIIRFVFLHARHYVGHSRVHCRGEFQRGKQANKME